VSVVGGGVPTKGGRRRLQLRMICLTSVPWLGLQCRPHVVLLSSSNSALLLPYWCMPWRVPGRRQSEAITTAPVPAMSLLQGCS
jgi:hypothetical protein